MKVWRICKKGRMKKRLRRRRRLLWKVGDKLRRVKKKEKRS
jgi:hypothetical protein